MIAGDALIALALVGLFSSTVYLGLVVVAVHRFRRGEPRRDAARRRLPPLPPISVLKPVHGSEARLEECLESFFRQAYGDFELIFGAREQGDAALAVVTRLRSRYPNVRVQVVVSGEPVLPNAKVSALVPMVARASSPYLVIADSDARVPPDCLAEVVRPLLGSDVGLVTCLYRGVPTGGLASRLEALGMSVEMTSGVLVADMLEGMRFALGPTIATRKDVLESVGGIAALGSYCADDYVLGQRVHAGGKAVVLSHLVIEHFAVNRSLSASLLHQTRWMRSTRFSRPWGHVGTGLTFAMPFGVLGLIAAAAQAQWTLGIWFLCWAAINRVVQCLVVGAWAVGDRHAVRWAWLYPLRDLLGFCTWCVSFAGAQIVWRGERYALTAGGRIERIGAAEPAAHAAEPGVAIGRDALP
jgi:ceramide glucosyltransferase